MPARSDVHYHGPAFRTTGELFDAPRGPLVALESLIRTQIADYFAAVTPPSPDHPYLTRPPRRWRPIAQATVLDSNGNLAPHVHYSGYVSGVYYVRVPLSSRRHRATAPAGSRSAGRRHAFTTPVAPKLRFIEPREGQMLLFPSYFYHSTVPFSPAETRISVAFDALPETG